MTIQGTDTFLVSRGGVNHKKAASDLMAIQDTDLLAINRGGVNYRVTGSELRDFASGGPGQNWGNSNNGLPVDTGFSSLAYSNGRFIGVGASYVPYTSTDDGITWSPCTLPTGAYAVAGTTTGFVTAAAINDPGTTYWTKTVYTSTDGSSWAVASSSYVNQMFSGNLNTVCQPLSLTSPAGIPTNMIHELFYCYDPGPGFSSTYGKSINTGAGFSLTYDASGNSGMMLTVGSIVANSKGYIAAGSHGVQNPLAPQPQSSGMFWYSSTQPTMQQLNTVSGTNSGYALSVSDKFVAAVNSPGSGLNTNVYVFSEPADMVTARPKIGTNAVSTGAWEPTSNILTFAGSGGSITTSYDGGLTWKQCIKQYDIAGVEDQKFVACAASPTCFITASSKFVLRAGI
jgi:hypothetical protein